MRFYPALLFFLVTFTDVTFTGAARAESCRETFIRLMVHGNDDGPVKIMVTQKLKGAPATVSEFLQVRDGYWMTRMIKPPNAAWTMGYDNAMYSSADKGKSWKKLRAFDARKAREQGIRNRQQNATTVKNAVCGKETLDGKSYMTVEADFQTLQNFRTENHFKYWIETKTGFIARTSYMTKGRGFESLTTQILARAPGLTIPKP